MNCPLCKKTKLNILERDLFDDRYGYPGKFSIHQCSNCHLGQTLPRLRKRKIPQIYNRYYAIHNKSPEQVANSVSSSNKIIRWLCGTDNVAHLYANPGENVLDIGSGSGVSLLEIHNLKAVGFGVEPDPSAQAISKKLGLKNVFEGEITQNPFPSTKFNLVTASQVIEHVLDPVSFVQTAKRKLKPKGKIIISTPNLDSLARKALGHKWLHWHVPFHQNYFTLKSLVRLAKTNNLIITKVRTITPNLWTLLQVRSLFKRAKYGVPSSIWNSQLSSRSHGDSNPAQAIYKLATWVFLIACIPLNRLVDLLGLGESWLIFLETDR